MRTCKTSLRTTARSTALAAALGCALPALATNGYFPHGYGIKAKGMGGVSTATADDALGGATNPAKMAFAGSRLDLGLEWFSPRRDAERTGAGPLSGKVTSEKETFWVPELGYNRALGDAWAVGLTVYGNGGMNTTYPQGSFDCGGGPANAMCGGGRLGVDLMQLVVAPTVAFKLAGRHALGASLLLGYQRFKAEGLQAFDTPMASRAPGSVTNNGYDDASGAGLRIGYLGRLSDAFSLGAAYSSKIDMSRFKKYAGLFAGQGDFDIPSNWNVGVAFTPAPGWTLAADYQRINYSDVRSVSNPSMVQVQLGEDGGPGFGWRDIGVFKIGLAWQASPALVVRAGYNRGDNPIRASDVTFNILAPGVMTDHYTLGFTYALGASGEISGAAMVAPRQTVTGASMFAGTETIGMRQYSLSLGWSMKF
ncbi:MAG: outer membrane protein transport protein [Rubrivivax sp.]|nr:outer membrane protein transport protein [Rubrivivax sp.]